MLPKIQATIDARDEKIAADLKAAEQARAAADALEEAYRADMDKSRAEAASWPPQPRPTARQVDRESGGQGRQGDWRPRSTRRSPRSRDGRAAARAEIEAVAADAAQADGRAGLPGSASTHDTARAAVAKELANG